METQILNLINRLDNLKKLIQAKLKELEEQELEEKLPKIEEGKFNFKINSKQLTKIIDVSNKLNNLYNRWYKESGNKSKYDKSSIKSYLDKLDILRRRVSEIKYRLHNDNVIISNFDIMLNGINRQLAEIKEPDLKVFEKNEKGTYEEYSSKIYPYEEEKIELIRKFQNLTGYRPLWHNDLNTSKYQIDKIKNTKTYISKKGNAYEKQLEKLKPLEEQYNKELEIYNNNMVTIKNLEDAILKITNEMETIRLDFIKNTNYNNMTKEQRNELIKTIKKDTNEYWENILSPTRNEINEIYNKISNLSPKLRNVELNMIAYKNKLDEYKNKLPKSKQAIENNNNNIKIAEDNYNKYYNDKYIIIKNEYDELEKLKIEKIEKIKEIEIPYEKMELQLAVLEQFKGEGKFKSY